jgi:hypothetical protein
MRKGWSGRRHRLPSRISSPDRRSSAQSPNRTTSGPGGASGMATSCSEAGSYQAGPGPSFHLRFIFKSPSGH